MNDEKIIELSIEQKLIASKIRFSCQKFYEILLSLPDEVLVKYHTTPDQIDAIFKPTIEKLYKELADNNISLENMDDAIELIGSVQTFTMNRIINYFDPAIKYVYKNVMGYEDPYKEMSIGEWEKKRNEIALSLVKQDFSADLSTDKSE